MPKTLTARLQSAAPGAPIAAAYYAVAECQEALGDAEAAIVALERYMEVTRLGAPRAHARACCKFGALYQSMGRYAEVRTVPLPPPRVHRCRPRLAQLFCSLPVHGPLLQRRDLITKHQFALCYQSMGRVAAH